MTTRKLEDLQKCCDIFKVQFPEFKYTPDDLKGDDFVVFVDYGYDAYFILHLTYDYVIFAYSYIAPENRGFGYGKSLTKQVIDYAKRYSRPIKTTIRLTNIPSYRIALDVGFIPQRVFIKNETTWVVLMK